MLGLLLIAAIVIAPLTTGALAEVNHGSAPLAGTGEHLAGCHVRGAATLPDSRLPHSPRPGSPRPAPVSYQCCLTGHDVAVVQTSFSPQPSAGYTRVTVQIEPALTIGLLNLVEVSVVLSADPPGATPLRI